MVPAVSLAFPAVVVVVTGASRRPHIRKNQNLGLMLHNTCEVAPVSWTELGRSWVRVPPLLPIIPTLVPVNTSSSSTLPPGGPWPR